MRIQHFVEFYFPGALFDESTDKEIATRDPEKVTVPDSAFGFSFYTLVSTTTEYQGDTVLLTSERLDESRMYYYGGRILDKTQVANQVANNRTLLSNMRNNGYKFVIQTRAGNFKPFDPKFDTFIPEKK